MLAPVTGHDLWPARDNFAGLADRDLVSLVALRITGRGLAAIRIDEHRAFLETQEPAAPGKGPIHGNEFS